MPLVRAAYLTRAAREGLGGQIPTPGTGVVIFKLVINAVPPWHLRIYIL
jgi:hypothetical protein